MSSLFDIVKRKIFDSQLFYIYAKTTYAQNIHENSKDLDMILQSKNVNVWEEERSEG